MSIEEILEMTSITAYSKLLYFVLNKEEELLSAGNRTLAKRLGTNAITISRAIKQLKDNNLINVKYSDNELSKKIEIL